MIMTHFEKDKQDEGNSLNPGSTPADWEISRFQDYIYINSRCTKTKVK